MANNLPTLAEAIVAFTATCRQPDLSSLTSKAPCPTVAELSALRPAELTHNIDVYERSFNRSVRVEFIARDERFIGRIRRVSEPDMGSTLKHTSFVTLMQLIKMRTVRDALAGEANAAAVQDVIMAESGNQTDSEEEPMDTSSDSE